MQGGCEEFTRRFACYFNGYCIKFGMSAPLQSLTRTGVAISTLPSTPPSAHPPDSPSVVSLRESLFLRLE